MKPYLGARACSPLPVIHREFGRAPPLTAVASSATSLRGPQIEPIFTALRAPIAADGRHGDTVDENSRDLRSTDVMLTLVDGTVNFHVRFSKVILTAPALLTRVTRVEEIPWPRPAAR